MKLFLFLAILNPSLALLAGLGLTMPSPRMRLGRQQDSDTTSATTRSPPRVQREYETWTWKSNHGTYRINYRAEGPKDGTPILLTHGFGANLNHFRHQFPALVDSGYRVYAMDLLGFGASEKPSNVPYSIDLFTQQMIDFVATHDKGSWILAGNSMGGLCSLNAAAKVGKAHTPRFDISTIILFNSGKTLFMMLMLILFVGRKRLFLTVLLLINCSSIMPLPSRRSK